MHSICYSLHISFANKKNKDYTLFYVIKNVLKFVVESINLWLKLHITFDNAHQILSTFLWSFQANLLAITLLKIAQKHNTCRKKCSTRHQFLAFLTFDM